MKMQLIMFKFNCCEKNYKQHNYKHWFYANKKDIQNPEHHKNYNL